MKRQSKMELGAEFFSWFVKQVMDVSREMDVPFAAVEWLAREEGRDTLRKMLEVAKKEYEVSQTILQDKAWRDVHPDKGFPEYPVKVVYRKRSLKELGEWFYEVDVSYEGAVFTRTSKKVFSLATRTVLFDFMCLYEGATTEEVLEEIVEQREERAATFEELLAFIAKFGTAVMKGKMRLVAFGSVAEVKGVPHVACVRRVPAGFVLGLLPLASTWAQSDYFLKTK